MHAFASASDKRCSEKRASKQGRVCGCVCMCVSSFLPLLEDLIASDRHYSSFSPLKTMPDET